MINQITDCTVLSNGVRMPWLGFGVFKVQEGEEVVRSVQTALEVGYRSIDTAATYGNEAGVGRAVGSSGVPREEIFVTTKVWNTRQGYDSTLQAFEESRKKLNVEYVDLYLIHWPVKEKYKETWKALEKLYKDGWVRSIGVSNFLIHHLEDLMANCEIAPMVNQVEYHPLLTLPELRQYCKENAIQLEAWSPLMRGNLSEFPEIAEIARKYGKTAAQLVLRWDLQHQVVTIPKSVRRERIQENAEIFDFEITAEDMSRLDGLNRDQRFGQHPDNFSFPS